MDLETLNRLPAKGAVAEFLRCCGSRRWAERMAAGRPYSGAKHLMKAADAIWGGLDAKDWLEAFSHHPKIGDRKVLEAKFAATADWAQGEQSGVKAASAEVLDALAAGNAEYEKKFGFIFLVCATGKTAPEMMELLRGRMNNSVEDELKIAAREQGKITKLRLEKLLGSRPA